MRTVDRDASTRMCVTLTTIMLAMNIENDPISNTVRGFRCTCDDVVHNARAHTSTENNIWLHENMDGIRYYADWICVFVVVVWLVVVVARAFVYVECKCGLSQSRAKQSCLLHSNYSCSHWDLLLLMMVQRRHDAEPNRVCDANQNYNHFWICVLQHTRRTGWFDAKVFYAELSALLCGFFFSYSQARLLYVCSEQYGFSRLTGPDINEEEPANDVCLSIEKQFFCRSNFKHVENK